MNLLPKENLCIHFGKCGGCTDLLSLHSPSIWEEVVAFFKEDGIPVLHQDSPIHWRHRAKMAVRGTKVNPEIGLFQFNSHDVLSIPFCMVHHPKLNIAFEKVRQWMVRHSLAPYQEKTQTGDIRYLQGVVERRTEKVQLTIVLNIQNQHLSDWKDLIKELSKEDPFFWHSLWINLNTKPTNTIFGPQWIEVWGEPILWEFFGDTAVCYGPESFGQANLPLFEKMLFRIDEMIPPKSRISEFYAGVGAIGLYLASKHEWIRCTEINPTSQKYFDLSVQKLKVAQLSFLTAPCKAALHLLEDATTAIVDPPRKGLDPFFFEELNQNLSVKQLIYISCGWEAFKKDYEKLKNSGWKVKSCDGYLFFPGTNHVELLVNFVR